MSDTTDALESLLAHPGWHLLCDQARREFAERERIGRHKALNDTDDKRALDKLRQITAAQEAVEWVLALPKEEIAKLRRQDTEAPAPDGMYRGGPSQSVFAMNRRGTL